METMTTITTGPQMAAGMMAQVLSPMVEAFARQLGAAIAQEMASAVRASQEPEVIDTIRGIEVACRCKRTKAREILRSGVLGDAVWQDGERSTLHVDVKLARERYEEWVKRGRTQTKTN